MSGLCQEKVKVIFYYNHYQKCADSTITTKSQENVTCIFCGEKTGTGDNSREAHIGRHMEEIAFSVVSKPYDEWEFYSDSSVNSKVKDVVRRPTMSVFVLDSKLFMFLG